MPWVTPAGPAEWNEARKMSPLREGDAGDQPPGNLYVTGGPVGQLPPMQLTEMRGGPNLAERIIRSAMHVAAIITLVLVSLLMVLLLSTVVAIGHRLDAVTPDPAVTGCPFGDGECGG